MAGVEKIYEIDLAEDDGALRVQFFDDRGEKIAAAKTVTAARAEVDFSESGRVIGVRVWPNNAETP